MEALDEQIAAKKDEVRSLGKRVQSFDKGVNDLENVERALETDEAFRLSEPPPLMSAKTYKTKFAEPLVKQLKKLLVNALEKCFAAVDNYHRLNVANGNLYQENEKLSKINDRLKDENENLRSEVKDYKLLRKVFGSRQIDDLLARAREAQQSKQREKRFRNHDYER